MLRPFVVAVRQKFFFGKGLFQLQDGLCKLSQCV